MATPMATNRTPSTPGTPTGSFSTEDAITRLIGALPFEQNDEWQSQNRYMQLEAFSLIDPAVQTDPPLSITSPAARPMTPEGSLGFSTTLTDATDRRLRGNDGVNAPNPNERPAA